MPSIRHNLTLPTGFFYLSSASIGTYWELKFLGCQLFFWALFLIRERSNCDLVNYSNWCHVIWRHMPRQTMVSSVIWRLTSSPNKPFSITHVSCLLLSAIVFCDHYSLLLFILLLLSKTWVTMSTFIFINVKILQWQPRRKFIYQCQQTSWKG